VNGWERWVRSRQELGRCRLVVTGSNTDLMKGELATSLTGRHLDVTVLPLGFSEFLAFKGALVSSLLDLVKKKTAVNRLFREYMEFGGFPMVALSEAKKEILGAYYDDILTKDIARRHRVRELGGLGRLAEFYLTNISCPASFRSLEQKVGLSVNTLEKFSGYLASAMMVFFVGRFGWSFGERNKSPRKAYAIDPGLSNAVGFRFAENAGALAENIVALELLRRKLVEPSMDLFYWRNEAGHEVDFVVKKGKRVTELIQVCWDVSDAGTKKREQRALTGAMEKLGLNRGLVLNEDFEGVVKAGRKTIEYRPILKWLLDIE